MSWWANHDGVHAFLLCSLFLLGSVENEEGPYASLFRDATSPILNADDANVVRRSKESFLSLRPRT